MASDKDHTETSALIDLNSLESDSRRQSGHAMGDESGLIDLSGFTGGAPAETNEARGVPTGGPITAGIVIPTRQKSNTGLIIALAVIGVVLLVGVAVFVGMKLAAGDEDPTVAGQPGAIAAADPQAADKAAAEKAAAEKAAAEKAAAEKAAADEKAGDEKAGDEKAGDEKAGDEKAGDEKAVAGAGDAAEKSAPVAAAKPKPTRRANRRARPTRAAAAPTRNEDAPPAAAATPKPAPSKPKPPPKKERSEVDDMLSALDGGGSKPAGGSPVAAPAAADPLLPERLTRRQILTVVKRNAGSVRKCKSQPPGTGGNVMVKMSIAGSGSVTSAKVAGGPTKGTAQGNCIERTVKVFRFPQFSGPNMSINMPFAL